jgi:UDP-glucose 4-epimerase
MSKSTSTLTTSSSVLLIGGAGFIGSHLTSLLAQNGKSLQVLSRSTSTQAPLPNVQYIQGDFNDEKLLEDLIESNDEIVNLAYATVPNTSFNDPLLDLNRNLPPVLRLMQLCAKYQKRLILVSSGGTVYGPSQAAMISEEHPTHPISPYGVTKLTMEHYAHLFSVSHGLDYLCLRPSNPYGLGQIPFRGQGFIATAIALIKQGKAVPVFGGFGTIRDYLEVSDLTRGMLAAMNHGQTCQIYNIGSGVGHSNVDVLNILSPIVSKVGYEVQIEQLPARPFDVAVNVLDSCKLAKISGWQPLISFQDGLESLVKSLLLDKSPKS